MAAQGETPSASADVEEINHFLEELAPAGNMLLVSIDPSGSGATAGDTFDLPEMLQSAVAWARDQNARGWNVYWTPNEAQEIGKKASKGDMVRARYCWVDLDPDVFAHGGYAAARQHLVGPVAESLKSTASLVIDSGNGVQAFWRLTDDEEMTPDSFEELNKRFEGVYGGKGTFNVDRVMRLPGTVNYPSPSKIKKGYPEKPGRARILHAAPVSYRPSQLAAGMRASELQQRLQAACQSVPAVGRRWNGDKGGLSDPSGSGMDMSMVALLRRSGFADGEIRELMEAWPHGSPGGREQGDRYWARMFANTDPVPQAPVIAAAAPKEPLFDKVGDMLANIRPVEWLVEGYLETDALTMVYGPSGAGKSFVVVDFACCVATGHPWHGMPVKQGAVFYIAGEGHNGMARRFGAWQLDRKVSLADAPLYKSRKAIDLFNPQAAQELAEEIDAMARASGHRPVMIVVDTVARSMGDGDENKAQDMGKFVANVDGMRHKWNANVLLVHHSGHGQDRARGSSSLRAALDQEYSVEGEKGILTLTNTKMKDAETPAKKCLKLHQVQLGVDADEIPIMGAVVVPHGDPLEIQVATSKSGQPLMASAFLKQVLDKWLPYPDLERNLGCTINHARAGIKRCAQLGLLERDGAGWKVAPRGLDGLSLSGELLLRGHSGKPIDGSNRVKGDASEDF